MIINKSLAAGLQQRSRRLVQFLDSRIEAIITGWIVAIATAGLVKVVRAPVPPADALHALANLLPYLLIALAPVAGYRIAVGSFPAHLLSGQPAIRLAQVGRWRSIDVVAARRHPAFGPAGFLASLTAGILLNVPVRTLELLTAMPAIDASAPAWAQRLAFAMTGDVIVMNFFYAVCFVMAIRSVPLFPRMLIFAWGVDIMMQFIMAHLMAQAPDLPAQVRSSLAHLLQGNIDKVLISALIWLPYLLLSERVNVTFRWRCAAH